MFCCVPCSALQKRATHAPSLEATEAPEMPWESERGAQQANAISSRSRLQIFKEKGSCNNDSGGAKALE